MEINKISKEIHANAVAKEFWEPNYNLSEKLMLVVSEIAEAQEADRKDRYCTASIVGVNGWVSDNDFRKSFEKNVKEKNRGAGWIVPTSLIVRTWRRDSICRIFQRLVRSAIGTITSTTSPNGKGN